MQLLELKDIKTPDIAVYYNMRYSAIAVYELVKTEVGVPVSFTIEIDPLGNKKVSIDILDDDISYPLIDLVKPLRKHILQLYDNGVL